MKNLDAHRVKIHFYQAKISIIMMENTVKVCNIFSSNIFFDQTSFITEILHVTFQDDQLSCIFP